ncbi:hypothetical protein HIM_10402 [Hirsutella minnesotensis 3608]|uniref:CCHC-type domain-containing protein n=1 Tax=Hirsutella minnesotensis 3608 TaxID=1043627 RepID=A0A0F7ZG38_9HYPO|nr:hypothetical protein HIM_10402 [Hirsutella minnesotensis 3608]
MTDQNCPRIFRQLQEVQRRTAQCERELDAIKSPKRDYEEALATVNACLDETWQTLYSSQNNSERSELQEKIVGYGRELERLKITFEAGLEDAEASYNRQIEAVWTGYRQDLITALGPALDQQTLQKLLVSNTQQLSPEPRKQRRITDEATNMETHLTTANQCQGRGNRTSPVPFTDDQVTNREEGRQENQPKVPIPGEVYLTREGPNARSAVLLLPTENLHDVGVPYTLDRLGLTKRIPECYEYSRREKIFRWRKLQTPSPGEATLELPNFWVPKTPSNPTEATSQTDYIKKRISSHRGSSPTSILAAVDQIAKGTCGIMHQVALLKAEVTQLREANTILSKRRRARKTRLRQGGSITIAEGQALQDQKDVEEQIKQEDRETKGRKPRDERKGRRCGACGKPGHNARTCVIDLEASNDKTRTEG